MGIFQESKGILGSESKKFTTILVVCFIALPLLLWGLSNPNSTFDLIGGLGKTKIFSGKSQNVATQNGSSQSTNFPVKNQLNGTLASVHSERSGSGSSSDSSQSTGMASEILLDGLSGSGFDEASCLSRFQSPLYHKTSRHKPSPYLLSKLQKYEDLHKRCGPDTESYNRALERLKFNRNGSSGCRYVVWLPANGLGNRMISLVSAFLYALLTNRVLLVDFEKDMTGLFCEPFPNTSWLMPADFPLKNQFTNSKIRYANSLGRLLMNTSESPPNYLYLNVNHGEYDGDKLFYCDQGQSPLREIHWLILLSDQYFAPSFFLIPSFRNEVSKMFLEKETIFHHLGRYLFHPSNQVWGLITRFYDAYLGNANEIISLQIRVFNPKTTPFETVMSQILQCTLKENLLPRVDAQKPVDFHSRNRTSKAILITSLFSEYLENISRMYWMNPTTTGEIVGVYQPTHEEYQHFGNNKHNVKALAEIYLLSFSDVLVTSAWSTFGYVAQGLAGLKPWILYKTDDKKIPDPPCEQDLSMEPCFHFPINYDCEANMEVDAGSRVPYLKHCKDLNWGVKLVGDGNEL